MPQSLKQSSPEILSFMDANVQKDISLLIAEVTFVTVRHGRSLWWRVPVHLMVTQEQARRRKGAEA